MSRPTRPDVDASSEGWVARIEDNFDKIFEAPVPLIQTDIAGLGTFNPKKYVNCLALVGSVLYVSDGVSWEIWREQLDSVVDLDTGTAILADVQSAYDDLLIDMRAKGWMSA